MHSRLVRHRFRTAMHQGRRAHQCTVATSTRALREVQVLELELELVQAAGSGLAATSRLEVLACLEQG